MSKSQGELGFSSTIIDPKRKRLGQWSEDSKGRRRLGGRWNLYRVAELLKSMPRWMSVDDLARVVYGTVSPTNRDNTRKHIPAQRRYMLNSLELPIVTRYGERGRIMAVKMYNRTLDEDKILLKMDLDRFLVRKELTEERYEVLHRIFLLGNPISKRKR